jgi:hypothetical protein
VWRHYLPLRDDDELEVSSRNRPDRTDLTVGLGYRCHSRSRTGPIPPPHTPAPLLDDINVGDGCKSSCFAKEKSMPFKVAPAENDV